MSGAPKGGLMLNSDLSPEASQGGRVPPTDKTCVVPTRRRVPTNFFSGRTLQSSIESFDGNSFMPLDFIVDGQVSGLGTMHSLLTLSFFRTWILPLHVVVFSSLILCTTPYGDGAIDEGGRLQIELAASSSCSARRRPWSDGRWVMGME